MVRVEMIPKNSVMEDIIDNWVASGREDSRSSGVFVFEDCESCCVSEGVVRIFRGNKTYFYTLSDFYRVKVIEVTQTELF